MFQWSDHIQTIFEDVKAILASARGLERPHLRDSFQLKVDASKVDAGAVLLHQDAAGIELLLPQVLFLPVLEKETHASILALKHFEVYLGSGRVLSWHKNPTQSLITWLVFLQPYHMHI